ncbi:MAG: outer membrane protein assembly factor BamE [Halioglobus sp.]|nr:outer membrane protein assembly factor BamE [Halioglobus sp.]
MRILLISLAITFLGACSFVGFPGVYKINIEQGNIVTQDMADQLKPGMNRRQVRFILGTPLAEGTFDQDRWDYIFVIRNGNKVLDQSRLTVVFEGDALVSISGDVAATNWGTPDRGSSPAPSALAPASGIPTGG